MDERPNEPLSAVQCRVTPHLRVLRWLGRNKFISMPWQTTFQTAPASPLALSFGCRIDKGVWQLEFIVWFGFSNDVLKFLSERICPLVCGHHADLMVFCVSFWRQLSRKTDITEQMLKVLALRPSFLALSPVAQPRENSAQTHLISPLYVPRPLMLAEMRGQFSARLDGTACLEFICKKLTLISMLSWNIKI